MGFMTRAKISRCQQLNVYVFLILFYVVLPWKNDIKQSNYVFLPWKNDKINPIMYFFHGRMTKATQLCISSMEE